MKAGYLSVYFYINSFLLLLNGLNHDMVEYLKIER